MSQYEQGERKLASIQEITALHPIEGADRIECAAILGWHVVVKKGEHEVGDLCIFCEPDSVMPDRPEYEFLRSKGFRVRTVRLRGQISQGLVLPLSALPSLAGRVQSVGDDVTQELGVTKHEVACPANLRGLPKGNFPEDIPKTKETRIQTSPQFVSMFKLPCNITEKLDGTSATFYVKSGQFGVCSRNLELKETDDNTYWQVARDFDIENKMRKHGDNFAIQGEIIGPGIQENKYKLNLKTFRAFNVFDIEGQKYENFHKFVSVIEEMGLMTVPVLRAWHSIEGYSIQQLVDFSEGKSIINSKTEREGIVIRPMTEARDYRIGRVTLKVISPKFLLKYDG